MQKKIFIYFLVIGSLLSCQQEKSPYFQPILKLEKGHFRGVSIGNTINEVKTIENNNFLIDEMSEFLHYEYPINMGNSYTVSYDFSSTNELYEIEITAFLDHINDADILFNNFNNHFTEKYGSENKEKDGYTTWKTTLEKKYNTIEIAMINQSISYGLISIKIRDLDY